MSPDVSRLIRGMSPTCDNNNTQKGREGREESIKWLECSLPDPSGVYSASCLVTWQLEAGLFCLPPAETSTAEEAMDTLMSLKANMLCKRFTTHITNVIFSSVMYYFV